MGAPAAAPGADYNLKSRAEPAAAAATRATPERVKARAVSFNIFSQTRTTSGNAATKKGRVEGESTFESRGRHPAAAARSSSGRTTDQVVRSRDALRARSCLCNESVKSHFEDVLRGVYPTEESASG